MASEEYKAEKRKAIGALFFQLSGVLTLVTQEDLCVQGWKIDWRDEFEVNGLPDESNWTYEVGKIRNSEAQTYISRSIANSKVSSGILILTADTQKNVISGFNEVRSASIKSKKPVLSRNSKIEVRLRATQATGTWPAVWALGDSYAKAGWPKAGEIDIFEYIGRQPNSVFQTIHGLSNNKYISIPTNSYITNASGEFNIYETELTDKQLIFSINKQVKSKIDISGIYPYNQPNISHHLIINLAIGGTWGGNFSIDDLPQEFHVDYIRAFKKCLNNE